MTEREVDPEEHPEYYSEHVHPHMSLEDEWLELDGGSLE